MDEKQTKKNTKQNQIKSDSKENKIKWKKKRLCCVVACDKITCLVVFPPGSVTGASEIIDWLAFVPTLKLLLPGNVVWMVMPPPLLLVLVVGVWGICWLFMLFPLAVLLLFNDPDDCTNGKFIVTERSSLIVCVSFMKDVRPKWCYTIGLGTKVKGPDVAQFSVCSYLAPVKMFLHLNQFDYFPWKWSQQCSFRKLNSPSKTIDYLKTKTKKWIAKIKQRFNLTIAIECHLAFFSSNREKSL